jgi:hypothetical protein
LNDRDVAFHSSLYFALSLRCVLATSSSILRPRSFLMLRFRFSVFDFSSSIPRPRSSSIRHPRFYVLDSPSPLIPHLLFPVLVLPRFLVLTRFIVKGLFHSPFASSWLSQRVWPKICLPVSRRPRLSFDPSFPLSLCSPSPLFAPLSLVLMPTAPDILYTEFHAPHLRQGAFREPPSNIKSRFYVSTSSSSF